MKNLFLGLAIGAVLSWVGGRDFLDEKAEEQLYCKNVEGEIWYDSRERFSRICGDAFEYPKNLLPKQAQSSRAKGQSFIM